MSILQATYCVYKSD